MGWTDEMVEDLRRMWKEGLTTGEIGKRLSVSKNSIVGKVHRLGLSGRPSPIKKKEDSSNADTPAPVKAEKAVKEEKAPTPAKVEKQPKTETHAPKEEKVEKIAKSDIIKTDTRFDIYKKGKTTLTDLDNHTCRWPIGDPKDETFHFCGKKIKVGQTYCEEHSAIAYVKTSKK